MISPEGRTEDGLEKEVKGKIVNYFFIIIHFHSLEQKYVREIFLLLYFAKGCKKPVLLNTDLSTHHKVTLCNRIFVKYTATLLTLPTATLPLVAGGRAGILSR